MTETRDISTTQSLRAARVRFAPSPTGPFHLGGLHTALFDWIYARRTGGQFILRIEDTDQDRFIPESIEDMMRSLRWLGLDWDEGPDIGGPYDPYVQSERKAIYGRYAQKLIDDGYAYRSYMTADELVTMRQEQTEKGLPLGYDRRDRHLSSDQIASYEAEGRTSVVRFAGPLNGKTVVHDLLRGDVEFENAIIKDPVLLKSDGMPTYHLAMVVDDHLMEITHVLRGQEWLPSAPIHKLLFDAFGWEMPTLVHLPVLLNPNGRGKISKRKVQVDGKEYPVLMGEVMEYGYLPDAMFNFLTNVGWGFGDEREIFDREEAIDCFRLEELSPAAAALPYEKLNWLNGVYIREMTPEALKTQLVPYLSRALDLDEASLFESRKLDVLVPVIQERLKLLTDAAELIDWAFVDASEIRYSDPSMLIGQKLDAAQSVEVLQIGATMIRNLDEVSSHVLEEAFHNRATEMGYKVGSFFAPFRVAITGKRVAPPLFESMVALGRDEVLRRLENAIQALQSWAAEPA